ncbi:RAI1-domain-containing protein [Lentinus tigrinus ALCF2SS1-7]|uniref:Decapping nuclease n=1 Tax=Lentinus tigrinus ALCF2SS1-6 TaxID=1328759 RepID=A0A5C2SEG1_9APHY|nr:RAI1-domain-containing protein [Lentinus tigrinus ALCF2SS1-6]RPD74631.1 RAI1-domain-containing protein [Lentinus tigrinus ALCF2SS1-7]
MQTFSYTATRVPEFTNSALRYYVGAPSGVDLRYGYERWIERPAGTTRLDPILRSIQRVVQEKETTSGRESWATLPNRIAVVTWRRIMTKILIAPYQELDTVELNAMFVGGILYLEEHVPDSQLGKPEYVRTVQCKLMYYGLSFGAWSTSSRPGLCERLEGHPAGWGGDVNTNVQWTVVAQTRLGNHQLVIGGEIDCVRDRFDGRPDTSVELKATVFMKRKYDEVRFNKKLLKFYIQSFLMGVPEIIVGFRTPAGQLVSTRSYKTVEIPQLVRNKPGSWNRDVCLQWGQQFFSTLRNLLSRQASTAHQQRGPEPPVTVWRVILTPKEGATMFPLAQGHIGKLGDDGEQRIGLLPSWYLDRRAGI